MKKGLIMLLTCLMLSGCQVYKDATPDALLEEVRTLAGENPKIFTTMKKELYSYYLPKDVGRIESQELSSVFMKNGNKFVMNFNPNHIVIHDYYQKSEERAFLLPDIIEKDRNHILIEGNYRAYHAGTHPFRLQIEKTEEKKVLLYMDMGFVNFSAITYSSEIQGLVHSMFIMAQSFEFDKEMIIARYSLKSSSEQVVDLDDFDEELPESGKLSDLKNKEEEK